MPFTQHLVAPKLPTSLANNTHVDLPGYDTFLVYVDQAHIIPIELDVSKFEGALSKVLQLYPHVAGQLQCADGNWSIELTNRGVPVDIDHKPGINSEFLLDGDWVIQDDLSQLLNQHPIGATVVNSSAPLLRLKLTLFDDETCIGVSWNHSIGDAIMMSRFMRVLSQFYQDLPSEFTAPTFEKYHFPAPSPSVVAELSSRLPINRVYRFHETLDIEGLGQVKWRFESRDLEKLRSVLCSDSDKHYLSKQDCLTAYLVAVLNHNRSYPVEAVKCTSSFRRISAPFIAENVAGNLILVVTTNVPKGITGIASAIRDAIVQCREPTCISTLVSLRSKHMLEAANTGNLFPFLCDHDELFVVSNLVIDWRSAHFGCPDGTRFHTYGVYWDILRCFRSNPVKGPNGVWRARQSVEISLGVAAELKPKILETLAQGTQYMVDKRFLYVPEYVGGLWGHMLLYIINIYRSLWTMVWQPYP